MKRILALSVALTALSAMPSYAADVGVAVDVPLQCSITGTPASNLTAGSVTVSATTGQLTGVTIPSTSLSIACNSAAATVTVEATPLNADEETGNTIQFTNDIGYTATLSGGYEAAPGTGTTAVATATATGDVGSQSRLYGRHLGSHTLALSDFTSGGKAVVEGGYNGTVTITLAAN